MTYLSSTFFPSVQEPPSPYSPFSREHAVYEVSLKVPPRFSWLKELSHAHRLVQALLQGELLGDYELFDFLVWPEGLFTRVSLKKTPSLAEFLRSLKEKSAPPEGDHRGFWEDELLWIRLVTPENLPESTRFFLETAESLRRSLVGSGGGSPNLFFFYRNPRLSR